MKSAAFPPPREKSLRPPRTFHFFSCSGFYVLAGIFRGCIARESHEEKRLECMRACAKMTVLYGGTSVQVNDGAFGKFSRASLQLTLLGSLV